MTLWKLLTPLACLLMVAGTGQAQPPAPASQPPQPPQAETASDSDPTRAVFLSLRSEYLNLEGNAWKFAQIVRMDRAWLKKRGWMGDEVGVVTRFDLPVIVNHNPGETQAGLGDLYAHALWVPWLTPKYALAAGSGVVFPTATQRTTGAGKWQAAPLLAPVWFLRNQKGFLLFKVQQYVSFAGKRDRSDVNYLLLTPTLAYRFQRRSWILVLTESKTNWENDNRWSYRTGVEIGHVLKSDFAIAIRPELPWGGHREGDWNLKLTLIWYGRR